MSVPRRYEVARYDVGIEYSNLVAIMILEEADGHGYTLGMKTAVSIPDDVFEKVERLARRSRRSRSEVFSAALREYVARHAPDEVTEAMDGVCDALNSQSDPFIRTASRRILEKTEW